MPLDRPLRVAIVNDYALVVAGLAGMLTAHADRVEVVELDSRSPVVAPVDLVLYDSFGQPQGRSMDLGFVGEGTPLVVFSWNTDPELVNAALDRGASGYVSKGVDGPALVELLERVHRGETVTPAGLGMPDGDEAGRWPGAAEGLSPREAEILALICQGLSNQEVTERAYLSINTVKSYIRSLYRKIDVTSRSQAVRWGLEHGFDPDHLRRVRPGAADPVG